MITETYVEKIPVYKVIEDGVGEIISTEIIGETYRTVTILRSDEGKHFVRKGTTVPLGVCITLSADDSPDNYSEDSL